jgi:ribosomal protein S18 acetylase RimI-like enzyme
MMLGDPPVEWERGGYTLSTDRGRLDLDAALALLQTTDWAARLGRDTLERAVGNSVAFGVYHGGALVGFGRVVTDLATYGYLTDVVIASAHRGRGLGRWLTRCVVTHPSFAGFRRLALLTRDADRLYAMEGFRIGAGELVYMEYDGPWDSRTS